MPLESRGFFRNLSRLPFAVVVIAAALSVIWSSISVLLAIDRVNAIEAAPESARNHANTLLQSSHVVHPFEWTTTATYLPTETEAQASQAVAIVERALVADPNDPHSWALLAYLQKNIDGLYSPKVDSLIRRSIAVCPYCDRSLLRWRLTFILDNWKHVSEETRVAVFSGADFLRWWHLDYEYLDDVRSSALQNDIPFDDYRSKIDTPVRPNEIGRTELD